MVFFIRGQHVADILCPARRGALSAAGVPG